MWWILAVLLLFSGVNFCKAEMWIPRKFNGTIIFEGDSLKIRVDNPRYIFGTFELCLRSIPSAKSEECPQGYAYVFAGIFPNRKSRSFEVYMKGSSNDLEVTVSDPIILNDDGSLNVFLAVIETGATMVFLNAEKYVPPITEIATTEKVNNTTNAKLGLILCGFGLVFILVVVCFCIWFFFWRRKTVTSNANSSQK